MAKISVLLICLVLFGTSCCQDDDASRNSKHKKLSVDESDLPDLLPTPALLNATTMSTHEWSNISSSDNDSKAPMIINNSTLAAFNSVSHSAVHPLEPVVILAVNNTYSDPLNHVEATTNATNTNTDNNSIIDGTANNNTNSDPVVNEKDGDDKDGYNITINMGVPINGAGDGDITQGSDVGSATEHKENKDKDEHKHEQVHRRDEESQDTVTTSINNNNGVNRFTPTFQLTSCFAILAFIQFFGY